MSGLFSHSPASDDAPGSRPDLATSVLVPASGDHAWAGLTEHLHLWWPAAELSRWGESSFFDLEDNALVETSAEDDENVWGEVIGGEAGHWLELRWRNVGSASTTLLRLEVRDGSSEGGAAAASYVIEQDQESAVPSGTTLTLTHSGWSTADPPDLYTFYRDFWPMALGRYRRFMGGS